MIALLAVAFVFLSPGKSSGAPPTSSDRVMGEWLRPDGARVQVMRCGEHLCGRIVKVPDPTRKDLNNPQARLRIRPLTGIELFTSERRAGNEGWKVWLYNPEDGSTNPARLVPLDRQTLEVSVCKFFNLLCSSETWVRTR